MRRAGFTFKGKQYTVENPCGGSPCSGEDAVAWMAHAGAWLVFWLDVLAQTPPGDRPGFMMQFVNGSRYIVDRFWELIDEQRAQKQLPENMRNFQKSAEGFAEIAEDAQELAEELGGPEPTEEQVPSSWGDQMPMLRIPGRPIEEQGFWDSLVQKFDKAADDALDLASDVRKMIPWLIGAYILAQAASISRSFRK